ncbi:MAG: hypothetical protein LC791_02850 [Acidobacteria bacterium]|nr:hypothetical protein [Acidobacteriota bacterium]
MKLAGQGEIDPRRRHESGYAMAALLVGMTMMAILMGAALPSWTHMAQREKEEEYLFRARQYARAIRTYQDKMQVANVPAPSVDFLIEQRFLRKRYKDPLSGEDFALIQAPVAAPPGQVGQPQPQPGGQGIQGAQTGGFIGVTSKKKKAAIKLFKGQATTYDQWAMTFMDVPSPMGRGVPGAAGATNPAGGSGFQPVNPGAFGGGGVPPGSMGGGASPFSPAGPNQPVPQFPGGSGFGQPTQPPSGALPFGQPMQPAPGQPVQKFPPPPSATGTRPFQPVPVKPPL